MSDDRYTWNDGDIEILGGAPKDEPEEPTDEE